MKNLKTFALLFISLFSTKIIYACGGGWFEASYYNIYQIELMLDGGTLGSTYHNNRTPFEGSATEDNIKEWDMFFEGKYSIDKIADWIYTEDEFANTSKIQDDLSDFNSQKSADFVDYITIAKKAETISNAYDPWDYYREDEPERDMGFINKLTKDIQSKLRVVQDDFLQERYTFQLVKLYYYSKRYDKAISTYDLFYRNGKSNSIMSYWGLDYKAGAQMQSGDTIQANYNFLQVFDQYPGRRHKSYYSMIFSNEAQFSQTLGVCESDGDKAAFHFVRGVNKNSVVLEDLKASFSFSPNSEYAKVLMVNELVKMEHIFWNRNVEHLEWSNDVEDMPLEQLGRYVKDFIDFAEKAVKQADDKAFWNISLAYLNVLDGDYQKAKTLLTSINTANEQYQKQVAAITLLNYIHLNPNFNKAAQNEFGQMWFDYNNGSALIDKSIWGGNGSINSYLADYFEAFYKEKDPLKSFLFSGQHFANFTIEYEDKLDVDEIHELRLSLEKADKTVLQAYGESSFLAHSEDIDMNSALMEVEATLLMRNPETLPEALAYFEKLSSTAALETNPFNMDIRDCIWGGWGEDQGCNHKTGNYTKLTLAKKLVEMKRLAEENQSAMDYYLLGNAYYNMTYFGHANKALSYYRSGSSYTGFNDCSAALAMYEKAIPLFEDNREMQAKAIFMASKCEQNLYFIDLDGNSEYGYWGIDYDYKNPKQSLIDYNAEIATAGYRDNFELLKKNYTDTKFYQQIIDECSYFDLYVHY